MVVIMCLLVANAVLSSATILSPLKVDPSSLHLYKTGLRNELDYVLKRSAAQDENPDSKERRSQMGSSFIRFGRSQLAGNVENPDYGFNEVDSSASRIPRGRSDVIIRFGRSGKMQEHGKVVRVLPVDLEQLAFMCSIGTSESDEFSRLCALLGRTDDVEKN